MKTLRRNLLYKGKTRGRLFGIWLLLAIVLIGMPASGIGGGVYLMFPESEGADEEKQQAVESPRKATESAETTGRGPREGSKAEIERAWAKVKKPIYVSVAGGAYSEDQSAVDAFMKGFVRRLTITNEFEISYTDPKLDKEGGYPNPYYMVDMLMDKTQAGLYYGYVSINRIHRICRCQDGFQFRLSEEVPYSTDIFSNYSFSRLVELGAEYAQQAYDAIERDLLKDMGIFWFEE